MVKFTITMITIVESGEIVQLNLSTLSETFFFPVQLTRQIALSLNGEAGG